MSLWGDTAALSGLYARLCHAFLVNYSVLAKAMARIRDGCFFKYYLLV